MGSGVRIRAARRSDVPGIVRCLRLAFRPFRDEYTSRAYADTTLSLETARARLASMHVRVAVTGTSRVVGTFAWALDAPGVGHLRGMAVEPARHGTGLASELLERALRELADAGARRVTLDTTAPLARAVRFYEKNGFRRTGRVRDFYGMPLFEFARDVPRRFTGAAGTRRSRDSPRP
jgi:ribosomal protein S18 acetylase RimI-like enzyme